MPGGVDEYLRLRQQQPAAAAGDRPDQVTAPEREAGGLSGAERRAVAKEVAAIERKLQRNEAEVARLHQEMTTHDQSDYTGLQSLAERLRTVEDETSELEERWLDLSDALD